MNWTAPNGAWKAKKLSRTGLPPTKFAIFTSRKRARLSAEDKTQIVVQRIYQQYKGFSVIDEIRDMKIDGVSGGVSGIPPSMWEGEWSLEEEALLREVPRSHDSVWLFYKGKSIHPKFRKPIIPTFDLEPKLI